MKEITGNIFSPDLGADAICVTTNGCLRANGELVMGAGIAQQFAERYPNLPRVLGLAVKDFRYKRDYRPYLEPGDDPNHVYIHWTWDWDGGSPGLSQDPEPLVVSYPTKHDWRYQSDPELIERSARELVKVADYLGLKKVVLPRPGCGLGGLRWRDVKKVIEPILDDRFYIITPG